MRVAARWVAAWALCLPLAVGSAPQSAHADECSSQVVRLPGGVFELRIVCPADDDTEQTGSSARKCVDQGAEVPCVTEQGRWYSPAGCYLSRLEDPPPFSDPLWQGHDSGSLYYCRTGGTATGTPLVIWLDSAEPPPDPEALAREAVRRMQLRPIAIGIAPDDAPGSVGLVGMPVWLWADDPGTQTMGPIAESVSEGDYTVDATAEVEQVRWTMGDGGERTCAGPGTRYEQRLGIVESPTCGYRFDTEGTYAVTARSEWVVTWTGIGEAGSFRVSLSSRTRIVIGELNVLTAGRGS